LPVELPLLLESTYPELSITQFLYSWFPISWETDDTPLLGTVNPQDFEEPVEELLPI